MDWTDWEERWLKAYRHGPARVLVRDQRRLREPLFIPVASDKPNTWEYPGDREPAALYQALVQKLAEDPNGA